MRHVFQGRGGLALTFILGVAVATAGTATAANLITGRQIKDGSLSSKDLSKAVQAQLKRTGAPGPPGSQGVRGDQGARGLSAWDAIPPGQTVTGGILFDTTSSVTGDFQAYVRLPGAAPQTLTEETVNFGPDADVKTVDDDPKCAGNVATPTAPPGRVCVYAAAFAGDSADAGAGVSGPLIAAGYAERTGFRVYWRDTATESSDVYFTGSWAYTAP